MKRGAVKVALALAIVGVGAGITNAVGYATVDRVAWGYELVKENSGGPVVLVKIHDNPTVWQTQFATGVDRMECGGQPASY